MDIHFSPFLHHFYLRRKKLKVIVGQICTQAHNLIEANNVPNNSGQLGEVVRQIREE